MPGQLVIIYFTIVVTRRRRRWRDHAMENRSDTRKKQNENDKKKTARLSVVIARSGAGGGRGRARAQIGVDNARVKAVGPRAQLVEALLLQHYNACITPPPPPHHRPKTPKLRLPTLKSHSPLPHWRACDRL